MAKRPNLRDISRQELIVGTSCITEASGEIGFKTEYVLASAQLRHARRRSSGKMSWLNPCVGTKCRR